MKRSLIVIGIAIIVAIGFLLVAPGFIDWSKRKPQIAAQLHEATGFNFEIKGDLELALVPYPRVVIGGLEVSNPDYHNQKILKLDKAEASLAVAPLFSGKVQVETVSLVKPDIFLEIGPEGQKSWVTDKIAGKEKTAEDPQASGDSEQALAEAVSWDAIKIKDGSFSFVDKQKEQSYKLTDLSALVKAQTVKGPYNIEAEGRYNGQTIQLDVETDKVEKNSLSLQLALAIPETESELSFSGVVGFGKQLEIQGQSRVKTAQLVSFLQLAGMQPDRPSVFTEQPLQAQALVTVSEAEIALHDLNLTYADMAANGKIVLTDRTSPDKPQALLVALNANKALNLDQFFSAGDANNRDKNKPQKTPAQKEQAEREAFLPATLTLPARTSAVISVKAPSVKLGGITTEDVIFDLNYKERGATGEIKAKLPGAKTSALTYALNYEAASRSTREGTVTLSDPVLAYQMAIDSEQGAKTVAAFFKPDQIRPYLPLVQGPMKIALDGEITPHRAALKTADIDLSRADFLLSGEYQIKQGRDKLEAVIRTSGINLDPWFKAVSPDTSAGAARASSETTKTATAGLDITFPFDLNLTIQGENISWESNQYDRIALLATLKGQSLVLKTLEVVAEKGDNLLISGTVKDIKHLEGVNLAAEAQTADLQSTLAGFGVQGAGQLPQALKAARFVGSFQGSAKDLGFTANMSGMNGSLAVEGAVGNLLTDPVFSNLTLRLKHPNYTELVQVFSPNFRSNIAGSKALDIYATMTRKDKIYRFGDLQATIGPSVIKGTVTLNKAQTKPVVTAELNAGNLPLDKLLGHDVDHKGTSRAQPMSQAKTENIRWSRKALNTDWMHAFNADLALQADQFSYGPWALSDTQLSITLDNGTLLVSPLKGSLYAGTVSATAKAVSSEQPREPLTAETALKLDNINLESFLRAFSGKELVRGRGVIALNTELATTGLSPAALIFSLRGQGQARGSNLVLEGFDLAKLSGLLAQPSSSMTENLNALLGASMAGGATEFETMKAAYNVSEGVVNFTELTLSGPSAVVKGAGVVNLPLWAIDMTMTIQLTEPADAPPLRVVFKGPLDNPRKSFGQSAMESYFQGLLKKELQDIIGKQLEKTGILPPQQSAPGQAVPDSETPTSEELGGDGAIKAEPLQPQTQPAPRKEIKPEDVFRGVLEGILEDAR